MYNLEISSKHNLQINDIITCIASQQRQFELNECHWLECRCEILIFDYQWQHKSYRKRRRERKSMKQWLILISFSARAITVTKSKTNKNVENFFFDVKKLWRVILDKNCQLTIPNWTAYLVIYLKFRKPFGNEKLRI